MAAVSLGSSRSMGGLMSQRSKGAGPSTPGPTPSHFSGASPEGRTIPYLASSLPSLFNYPECFSTHTEGTQPTSLQSHGTAHHQQSPGTKGEPTGSMAAV